MSLQQNIQTLYDNILSAKMWAALSDEVKLRLIRNPAFVDDMLDGPKKIAQQAANNNQQLNKKQEEAILGAPPCPFKDSSLKKFFLQYVPNGEKKLKEFRKQAMAETERYLTKELTPMLGQDEIYGILEHPSNRYGLENHKGPQLLRYSRSERKQRRAASAAVRKAHIQFADWAENTLPELPQLPRAYGALYMPEYADIQYITYNGNLKERNEEISWLFKPDSERYKKEKNDLVIKLGPDFRDGSLATRAQAVEERFAKRRGELVMERLKDFQRIYNNLDTLTDPSLPAAELEKNFLRIDRASNMLPDIKNYLEDAENGFLAVSEEDKAMMEAFQPNSVSSALLAAKAKLHLIANPLYEYLDINTMNGYNMSDIRGAYYGFDHSELEPDWRKRKIDRKPEFKNYAYAVSDNFSIMLGDMCNHIDQQGLAMKNNQDILDRFSFDNQSTTHFKENYSDEVQNPDRPDQKVAKHPDKPHAYQQGSRVVIIQQKTPMDTLSIMHPETMYNQSLRGNNALHMRTLLATDSWYMINHGAFRELKSALRKVDDLPLLKANFTQQDIDKAIRRFERLEKASTAYLESKERDRLRRTDPKLKEREIARVNETKKIQAYAKFKLKELQLVRDAKATLDKYQGKSLAELKALTAAENESAAMKSQIRQADVENRMANPGEWLKQMYSNAALPQKLRSYLDNNVGTLKVSYKHNNWLDSKVVENKLGLVQKAAGSVIAAQLVIQERRDRKDAGMDPNEKGPIETYVSDAKNALKWIDELGTYAINTYRAENGAIIPKEPGSDEPNPVYLANNFLNNFDPRDKLERYRSFIQPLLTAPDVAKKYVYSVEPINRGKEKDKYCTQFKDFARTSILIPAAQCADPAGNVSQETLDKLLSNTMVYEMIRGDRQNPPPKGIGSTESLLGAASQVEMLRTWMTQSDAYKKLRQSCLDENGQLSKERVFDTVKNGIPEKTIQDCKSGYKESFAAWKKGVEEERIRVKAEREKTREKMRARRAEVQDKVERHQNKLKLEEAPQKKKVSRESPLPKAPRLP